MPTTKAASISLKARSKSEQGWLIIMIRRAPSDPVIRLLQGPADAIVSTLRQFNNPLCRDGADLHHLGARQQPTKLRKKTGYPFTDLLWIKPEGATRHHSSMERCLWVSSLRLCLTNKKFTDGLCKGRVCQEKRCLARLSTILQLA